MTDNIDYTKLMAGLHEDFRRKLLTKELKTETNERIREWMLEELNKAPSEEYEYFIHCVKIRQGVGLCVKINEYLRRDV